MQIEENEITLNNIERNAWIVREAADLPPRTIHQLTKIREAAQRIKLEFGTVILILGTGNQQVEKL